jgi:hypothetical protein
MTRVVALVDDLMDRSRLSAAVPGVEFVRDAHAAAGADLVVIDLARYGSSVRAVRTAAPGAQIVAFGPHVDDEALAAARDAGADDVMPRSRFFRDPAAAMDRPQ